MLTVFAPFLCQGPGGQCRQRPFEVWFWEIAVSPQNWLKCVLQRGSSEREGLWGRPPVPLVTWGILDPRKVSTCYGFVGTLAWCAVGVGVIPPFLVLCFAHRPRWGCDV